MRFTIEVLVTHPANYILLENIFLTAGNRQSDAGSKRERPTCKCNILSKGSTLYLQSRLWPQEQLQQRPAPCNEITNFIMKKMKRYRS